MKKILFFVAALCYMVPSMAQQPNNYHQKLDSVYYNGEAVERLEYDNRLNCTKIDYVILTEPNEMYSTSQFKYDDENRIIKTEYWQYYGDYYESYDISYNEAGLVSEKVRTDVIHDSFVDYYKYTYEYEDNGVLLHTRGFFYNEDNEWVESYREDYFYEDSLLISVMHYLSGDNTPIWVTDYAYNSQRLCIEKAKKQGYSVVSKVLYTYDELGRKMSETKMEKGDDDELVYKEKREYGYNSNGDCTNYTMYEYMESHALWMLSIGYDYNYDVSVTMDDIAGLKTYWSSSIEATGIEFGNKVLGYTIQFWDGTVSGGITFHYSDATSVIELSENQLNVWPNPVNEVLNLETKDLQQVEIFSLDGRKVAAFKNGLENINVHALSNGCYLLRAIMMDGKTTTQRFVKQ